MSSFETPQPPTARRRRRLLPLLSLGADELEPAFVEATLGVLLKHQEDIESARTALKL